MTGPSEAVFFSVVAVLTAVSLWRELPLQYVITVAAFMYGIAALWYLLLREACWWLPLIVLNSRGVSRLIIYRWRSRAYYGWWLIGLTCVLSTILAPRWSTVALVVAMQIAAVPWIIKRRPTADAPSYFPLVNWFVIAAWMLFWIF